MPCLLPELDETPRRFRECDDFCIMTGLHGVRLNFFYWNDSFLFLFLPDMTSSEASDFFSLAGATTELQVCISTGVSHWKGISFHLSGD